MEFRMARNDSLKRIEAKNVAYSDFLVAFHEKSERIATNKNTAIPTIVLVGD
jgi:hypothetical protein